MPFFWEMLMLAKKATTAGLHFFLIVPYLVWIYRPSSLCFSNLGVYVDANVCCWDVKFNSLRHRISINSWSKSKPLWNFSLREKLNVKNGMVNVRLTEFTTNLWAKFKSQTKYFYQFTGFFCTIKMFLSSQGCCSFYLSV